MTAETACGSTEDALVAAAQFCSVLSQVGKWPCNGAPS